MGENPGNEVDGKIGDVYVFSYQSPSFFIAVSSILIPRVHALECRTMVEM